MVTEVKKHECQEFREGLGSESEFGWSLENRGDGWYMYDVGGERAASSCNFCPCCGAKL